MENDLKKRSRCVGFSPDEKVLIANICSRHKNVLENKKTDHVSSEEKKEVWGIIAEEVNSMSNNVYRSPDMLKRFYENRKREVRKIAAEERRQLTATGGGQAKIMKKDACHDVILSMMNRKTVYGLHNELDADSQTNLEVFGDEIRRPATQQNFEASDNDNENYDYMENDVEIHEIEHEASTSEVNTWKKYKPSDLKRPISSALCEINSQQSWTIFKQK